MSTPAAAASTPAKWADSPLVRLRAQASASAATIRAASSEAAAASGA